MKFASIGMLALATTVTFGAAPAIASAPAPDDVFTFDNSLVASNGVTTLSPYDDCPQVGGPCNDTSSFGELDGDGYWTWTSTDARYGGGFSYNPAANIGETYTYLLKFQMDAESSTNYTKIVDYLNLADDTGFYLYNGYVNFYNLGTGEVQFNTSNILDLVVVRDASQTPATFTVYTREPGGDLVEQLSVEDPDDQSVAYLDGSNHSLLGFFNNDSQYNEGMPAGKVFDLRFWYNTALTPDQIDSALNPADVSNGLASTGFDSTPLLTVGSLALVAGGIVARRRIVRRARAATK